MKVINSGSAEIKLVSKGKFVTLNAGGSIDLDERTFAVLKKMFPSLEAAFDGAIVEKEETIIEAKAQPIETKKKGTKNGNRKKSK